MNVFPIDLPPLRERAEEIPALVRYFVDRFARRKNRHIEVIPDEALAALQRCPWRGNIRELSNLIERAVTLSSGPRLAVPIDELDHAESSPARKHGGVTLAQRERDSILGVLEESNWLIAGPRGAAAPRDEADDAAIVAQEARDQRTGSVTFPIAATGPTKSAAGAWPRLEVPNSEQHLAMDVPSNGHALVAM